MKTSVVLAKALKLLKNGDAWIKGDFSCPYNRSGKKQESYCAIGAIRKVTGLSFTDYDVCAPLAEAVTDSVSREASYVYEFNDEPGRRFRDVARKFRKAIAAEKRAGR